jgi:CheY-like chemotaxis protein
MAATLHRGAAPMRTPLAGERVLAIDDDTDTRDMLSALLEVAGAQVQTAASGSEALVVFRRWRPTLILSDIGLPDQDGYELLGAIRALPGGDRVPAAALTAGSRQEDCTRAFAAGFQVHIAKPADADRLIAALVRLVRRGRC